MSGGQESALRRYRSLTAHAPPLRNGIPDLQSALLRASRKPPTNEAPSRGAPRGMYTKACSGHETGCVGTERSSSASGVAGSAVVTKIIGPLPWRWNFDRLDRPSYCHATPHVGSSGRYRGFAGTFGLCGRTPAQAQANTRALRQFLESQKGQAVRLSCRGDLYLDLSEGPITVQVGDESELRALRLMGPGRLLGVNAPSPITPVLNIIRAPGTIPPIVLRDLTIESDGSGIMQVNGGAADTAGGTAHYQLPGTR